MTTAINPDDSSSTASTSSNGGGNAGRRQATPGTKRIEVADLDALVRRISDERGEKLVIDKEKIKLICKNTKKIKMQRIN